MKLQNPFTHHKCLSVIKAIFVFAVVPYVWFVQYGHADMPGLKVYAVFVVAFYPIELLVLLFYAIGKKNWLDNTEYDLYVIPHSYPYHYSNTFYIDHTYDSYHDRSSRFDLDDSYHNHSSGVDFDDSYHNHSSRFDSDPGFGVDYGFNDGDNNRYT